MNQSSKLLDQVRDKIRYKHYSIRTEEAYTDWINRFILFHGKRHPKELGAAEVEQFLSHLAVNGNVASSTQNQALSAILFLYREVLQIELEWMDNITPAKRPKRLPVVLTRAEAQAVLAKMDGMYHLMASLLYGTGMRLMECARLRIKDVDFEYRQITVRDGKGQKDRMTMLPETLIDALRRQIEKVKAIHAEDVAAGYGEVYLPFALERKYSNAGREIGWQYIFPATKRAVDPRSGKIRRHHIDEKALQRAVTQAVRNAGLAKPASCHTFRHSFATHLLASGMIFARCRSCWCIKT